MTQLIWLLDKSDIEPIKKYVLMETIGAGTIIKAAKTTTHKAVSSQFKTTRCVMI